LNLFVFESQQARHSRGEFELFRNLPLIELKLGPEQNRSNLPLAANLF
jgi:hypothetical protein